MLSNIRDLNKQRYQVSQKIRTDNEDLARIQAMQEKFINDQKQIENTISDIRITTSGVLISHKLGRNYSGFSVIAQNTSASIYIVNDGMKDKFIKLKSDVDTTATIKVF